MRRLGPAAMIAALVLVGCGRATPTATSAPPTPTVVPTAAATETPMPSVAPASAGAAPVGARNPAPIDAATTYAPVIDPADFTTVIDNPFLPLVPGTTFRYEADGESTVVSVTDEIRTVMGVETIVVHDQVSADGKLVEDTFDWFAQDAAGNVWYFGEATTSYEHDPAGDPAGSWEAGVDGAQPGTVMLADPRPGDGYRQEYLAGEAEDLAVVYRPDGSIKTPAGTYDAALVTIEWTPLEPDAVKLKYYARGIGLVGERLIVGGKETVDLVEVSTTP